MIRVNLADIYIYIYIYNSRKQEKVHSMRNVLTSILENGVACSEESPRDRMNSCDVVKELHPIKLAD